MAEAIAEQPDREHERARIAAASGGDEAAFGELVEALRPEIHAHCYRMLGSAHDADDALQDAWLRAWRAIGRFEGRSSFKSWLYRIATNVCLDQIQSRKRRELPVDHSASSSPDEPSAALPLPESVWIEPYPDEAAGLADGHVSPDARYELRESVELAFVAAMQHLPPRQRAALILREVLGFSAAETAETLETTTASVNSALQRARATVDQKLPERSQQQTIRMLGEDGVKQIIDAYLEAWDRNDIEGVVRMLTEDARFSMPPAPYWFEGSEALRAWLPLGPLTGEWRWRHRLTHANGGPALGFYVWDEAEHSHLAFALNLLTLREGRISDVTAFICRGTEPDDPEAYVRWTEQPIERRKLEDFFLRFGLPERIDD